MSGFFVYHINARGVIETQYLFSGSGNKADSTLVPSANTVVTNETIYNDDTIDTIKRKIFKSINKTIPIEAMYLYGNTKTTLNAHTLFKQLSQNGKMQISMDRFKSFLNNIVSIEGVMVKATDWISNDKDELSYNDLLQYDIFDKEIVMTIAIGQIIVGLGTNYIYSIDPFKAQYDNTLAKAGTDLITTTNSSLLFENCLNENVLYLCDAKSLSSFYNDHPDWLPSSIPHAMDYLIPIYFPLLTIDNINSLQTLDAAYKDLIKNSNKLISSNYAKEQDSIRILNNVYDTQNYNSLKNIYSGIQSIEFILSPPIDCYFPIDIPFKILNATEIMPLIRLSPGRNMEKLYRLYATEISQDGRKIPYFTKSQINKQSKALSGSNRVGIVLQPIDEFNKSENYYCEIDNKGNIYCKAFFGDVLSENDINEKLSNTFNPIITQMNDVLKKNGLSLSQFKSVTDKNVEIVAIGYKIGYTLNVIPEIKKTIGCSSAVINLERDGLKDGVKMQYKRVADFQKMASQEAFIIRLLNISMNENIILEQLQDNFELEEDEARELLAGVLNRVQLARSGNREVKIRTNPGFPIEILQDPMSNTINCSISNIDNIKYIPFIKKYITSILLITQGKSAYNFSFEEVEKVCSKAKLKDVGKSKINDIIAITERPITENQELDIERDEFVIDGEGDEGLLDIMLGSDDDSDEEDDEDEFGEQFGGTIEVGKKMEKDITGMKMKNPNPIAARLQKFDDALFLKSYNGPYKAYSRSCTWNARRQPVVITDEEKEIIDKNHPGSYKHAIKYGSEPGKQYWYICPRFWSLKDNISLTEEQVKSGKYGEIIPYDADTVPPGANIIELGTDRAGNYTELYPGFMTPDKHPDGKCMPCCFTTWDNAKQKRLRSQCMSMSSKIDTKEEMVEERAAVAQDYIMAGDKFPLGLGRWGFLTPKLAMLFNYQGKQCIVSPSKPELKLNVECILRKGVEISKNASFISCLADLYSSEIGITYTTQNMINKLISILNLDVFVKLQAGSLIDLFLDETRDIEFSKYEDTEIYKTLVYNKKGKDLENAKYAIERMVKAYENYIDYLKDDTVLRDYTYLWDLVTEPNKNLFSEGINLIIIELPEDDITSNINIICPTGVQAKNAFMKERRSFILYKEGNFYEPIYTLTDNGKNFSIGYTFTMFDKKVPKPIQEVLKIAEKATETICGKRPSTQIYTFEYNINASQVRHHLKLRGYVIERQVINFNGQVIAFLVNIDDNEIYVPTLPSSPIDDYETIIMDEYKPQVDYEKMKKGLEQIYKRCKGKVLCKPVMRLVEEGMTVGLLTQTNQYIMIEEPEVIEDELPIKDTDYDIDADVISSVGTGIDKEREEKVNAIAYETRQFGIFRSTMRILLGRYENLHLKMSIEELTNSSYLPYLTRLRKINEILKKLDYVIEWDTSKEEKDLEICVGEEDEDKCNGKSGCVYKDKKCGLKLSKVNMITGEDNEKVYYMRLADELTRYTRVQSYFFNPQAILSFSDIGYNLGDNEIILLQQEIDGNYFDNLDVRISNKYVKNTSYGMVEPVVSLNYSNDFSMKNMSIMEEEDKNLRVGLDSEDLEYVIEPIKSKKWSQLFSNKATEVIIKPKNANGTFGVIMMILQVFSPDMGILEVKEMKEILVEKYERLIEEGNRDRIIAIWREEGKRSKAKLLKAKYPIDALVNGVTYNMTTIDLIILLDHFKLPVMLYSSITVGIIKEEAIRLKLDEESQSRFYIKIPSMEKEGYPEYRLLLLKKEFLISNDILDEKAVAELDNVTAYSLKEIIEM